MVGCSRKMTTLANGFARRFLTVALVIGTMTAVVSAAEEPEGAFPEKIGFGLGNSKYVSRPVDEAIIRQMAAEWMAALNRGDIAAVAAGFDEVGAVGDFMGIDACCGQRAVQASLERDIRLFYPERIHEFAVDDIWFIWKATIVYFNMPTYFSDIAVVKLDHTSRPRPPSSGPVEKSRMTAIFRKNTGQWKWHAVWPMMPVASRREEGPKGLLDGTIWYVPPVGIREGEILLFQDGRFISGTSRAKTLCKTGIPYKYQAKKKGDKIFWSIEEDSQKDTYRLWKGVVEGTRMSGEDHLISPKDDITDIWKWDAFRLEGQ